MEVENEISWAKLAAPVYMSVSKFNNATRELRGDQW